MNDNKYIGIFDSGFGGLSVLKYCINLMPNENYIYYADSKNAPFGLKTIDELKDIASGIVNNLMKYDLKEIIVACNTMSTNLFQYLQEKYSVHFEGTFPNFEHILKSGLILNESSLQINRDIGLKIKRNTKKLLIIATTATIKSKYIQEKVKAYNKIFDVYAKPADEIVKYVENDMLDSFECSDYLEELFASFKDTDYIVLGCTHFPFAKQKIIDELGKNGTIIDGCYKASENAKSYLEKNKMLNDTSYKCTIKIIDTNMSNQREKIYKKLIDNTNIKLEYIKNETNI